MVNAPYCEARTQATDLVNKTVPSFSGPAAKCHNFVLPCPPELFWSQSRVAASSLPPGNGPCPVLTPPPRLGHKGARRFASASPAVFPGSGRCPAAVSLLGWASHLRLRHISLKQDRGRGMPVAEVIMPSPSAGVAGDGFPPDALCLGESCGCQATSGGNSFGQPSVTDSCHC